jgi:hypothetical protein
VKYQLLRPCVPILYLGICSAVVCIYKCLISEPIRLLIVVSAQDKAITLYSKRNVRKTWCNKVGLNYVCVSVVSKIHIFLASLVIYGITKIHVTFC